MSFYQLSFIKLLRINSIAILIIYLVFNDLNNINTQINKVNVPPFPNQGDDFWILTYDDKLYHWIKIRNELCYIRKDVLDFIVGYDGIIFCIDKDNIRNYFHNVCREQFL
ncbi:hypothetical protein GLOIN_2v1541634 [Rhizophagus clarus]|uniref:Uncharacterized protein n=1 Tax=Rhizophagus clarus TaxID=94130 RepID=A0A8H3M6B6_9GLOM|nr:hypothetical protein GLOIN_2v1541634 [Rhizophagus clarus]